MLHGVGLAAMVYALATLGRSPTLAVLSRAAVGLISLVVILLSRLVVRGRP